MWKAWEQKYTLSVANSRMSSQFGVFVILIIGIIDVFYILEAISLTEGVSPETVIKAFIPVAIFVPAFGLRFVLLFRFASSIYIRLITWWTIVTVVYFCWSQFGPQAGVVYSLIGSFPLMVSGMLYVLIGTMRFVYFGSLSLHDIHSYS